MARKRKKKKHLSEADRERMRDLRREGASYCELAKKFGCSTAHAYNVAGAGGGGAATTAAASYRRWFDPIFARNPKACEIDQARHRALRIMREGIPLEHYLKARAELDRLIARIPPDEILYGGIAWLTKAIEQFAEDKARA